MTTYGNYDAGQSRPIGNPFLEGGVRSNWTKKADFNFDFEFKPDRTNGSKPAWGIERTTSVTSEQRVEAAAARSYVAVSSVADNADNDRFVDEYLSSYITPETRNRMASTSFTAAMAFGPMDNFLS